ncbi:extracellular medium-chain-length polyhydroxyalkanoate depolymerase [Spartinivicinus ruber]|uniref:extracellular medium-chain-length polyhydroxyalkanoate depolymerase n=1 Tax=Spartinivicinus ruber TaxID=2683272 RepID=UPI0013D052E2|nr:plasmid partitioning protein [Spartinivicinus ruber]
MSLLCCFSIASWADSRCLVTPKSLFQSGTIECSYKIYAVPVNEHLSREVKYQLPLGEPPKAGWPVVLLFQGNFFPVQFKRSTDDPLDSYYETLAIKRLLDQGFAVLAPKAESELDWLTNSAGPFTQYELTSDYAFFKRLLAAIKKGTFGPVDNQRKYAAGMASGGYNTSRMAVSFSQEFKALAIHSASYATCTGPTCSIPQSLPVDHPPTLFVHGFLDTVVPWWTMDQYYAKLLEQNIPTNRLTDYLAGHQWVSESPAAIITWFQQYP